MRSRNANWLVVVFIFAGMCIIQAQEKETPFFFEREKTKITTFFAEVYPYSSFSSLNKQNISAFEFAGGFLIRNRFYVAFFSANSPKLNRLAVPERGSQEWDNWLEAGVKLDKIHSDTEFLLVKFHHSGLKFGYLHRADRMVFFRTNLKLGFSGGFHLSEDQTFMGMFDNKVYQSKIFTVEPDIGVGINLLNWWRVHLDGGYRFVGVDDRILPSAKSDSFTFSLGFSFGNFKNFE